MRIYPLLLLILLTACNVIPARDHGTLQKINDEMRQAAKPKAEPALVPESVSHALLPPLRIPVPKASAKQLEQRFDLVVNDAPASQVLMGIVSGTRYSMLVHPDVKGNISVNLKDVTVFEALDAVREMYGYDYRVEGSRIHVQKPGLQARIFKVNYIAGIRRGGSDISVTSGSAGEDSSGSNGGGTINRQQRASNLNMSARTDFWGDLEDAARTVLGCQIPGQRQSQTSSGGTGATAQSSQAEFAAYETRDRGNKNCPEGKSVVLNPLSGTLFVRGMPDELRLIGKLLHTMQVSVEKQVILEAKIIDVELNSGSQQGINWAGFHGGNHRLSGGLDPNTVTVPGGSVVSGTTLGGMLGTGLLSTTASTAFSAGLGIAFQLSNFSALIAFLESQGEVHVLSSPRIATINNQKAVLKVGRDEQFVTGFETNNNTTTTTGGTTVNIPTPVYSTFFSGISLDVTPQIDDEGNITLHVHPLVSEVTEVMKVTMNDKNLPFASNKISETDSVVKVKDGQIVVIGGLMTEAYEDSRSKVPGLSNAPGVGAAFRKNGQQSTKRELVIMLKPTVVHDNGDWADDLAATQQRIEGMGAVTEPAQ
jgi:MSHA biogenesis protein MshL